MSTVRDQLQQFWDKRYAVPGSVYGTEPNSFLVEHIRHVPARARADVHRHAVQALKPGGVFLWEGYGPAQLDRNTGGPRDAALLPALDEVARDFPDCTAVHSWSGSRMVREGSLHTGEGSVTQFIARKTT